MKNLLNFVALFFVTAVLCACSFNPVQPILLITMKDMFLFGFVYLIAMFILSLYLSDSNGKFWVWFILGLCLPPIPIIAALVKGLSAKK